MKAKNPARMRSRNPVKGKGNVENNDVDYERITMAKRSEVRDKADKAKIKRSKGYKGGNNS